MADKVDDLTTTVNNNYSEFTDYVADNDKVVKELTDELANVNTELANVSNRVSDCESEISDIKLDITEIQNTLSECASRDDLAELENTVSMKAWKSDLDNYQTQLDNYKIEIDSKVNSLTAEHLNMKDDVLNVGKDIVKLENKFVNNKDKVNDEINELISRVDSLEKRPVSGGTGGGSVDLSGIQAQIQDLYNKYNDTVYDDSDVRQLIDELKESIAVLENKEDKDTIYDDSEVRQELSKIKSEINNLKDINDDLVIETGKPKVLAITNKYSGIDYRTTDFDTLFTSQLKGECNYSSHTTYSFTVNNLTGNIDYVQFPCNVPTDIPTAEYDVIVTIKDFKSNEVLYTGTETVSFVQNGKNTMNDINLIHELTETLTVDNQNINIVLDFRSFKESPTSIGSRGVNFYKSITKGIGTNLTENSSLWSIQYVDSIIVLWSKSLSIKYYDDTEIKNRLTALENKEDVEAYDDTALRSDVSTLETKVTDIESKVNSI